MDDARKALVQRQPFVATLFDGETRKMRHLMHCDLIVRVCVNDYDTGFWNGDSCLVLYETEDGYLVIRRLRDSHEGIVSKDILRTPVWFPYQY